MADLYRSKVETLAAALQRDDTRLEASEMLRGLIDPIVFLPAPPSRDMDGRGRYGAQGARLRIELKGNLAAMLTAAQQAKRSPDSGDLEMPVHLVAGARCRHCRPLSTWWQPDAPPFLRRGDALDAASVANSPRHLTRRCA